MKHSLFASASTAGLQISGQSCNGVKYSFRICFKSSNWAVGQLRRTYALRQLSVKNSVHNMHYIMKGGVQAYKNFITSICDCGWAARSH